MSLLLQYIITAIIIAAAVGYVSYRFWRLVMGCSANHCGSCAGCSLYKISRYSVVKLADVQHKTGGEVSK